MLIKLLKWAPLVQALLLGTGAIICFGIAYRQGNVNLYLPYISETGAYSPEMCIFSLTLILGSFIGSIIVLFQYILMSQMNNEKRFIQVNNAAFAVGMIAMLGLAGVAAFPMTTVYWTHLLLAGIFFLGSTAYFVCSTYTTFKIQGRSKLCIFRCIISALLVVLLFLCIFFGIAHSYWHQHNDIIPALKTPENQGFGLVLFSSILEWVTVGSIIVYNLTFMKDQKNFCVEINVINIKSDISTAECTTTVESSP